MNTPVTLDIPQDLRRLDFEARRFSKSSLCPKALQEKPDEILLIAMRGQALGLRDLQTAIAHLYLIDAKIVMSAQLRGSLATAAGHVYWSTEGPDFVTVAGHRRGHPEQRTTVSFSMDDARAAGLLDFWWEKWTDQNGRRKLSRWIEGTPDMPDWVGKPGAERKCRENWHKWPRDLLFARALTRWVGRTCPEVLLGLPVFETPYEEVDRKLDADAVAPARQSFIDVEELDDDPIDVTLIEDPTPAAPRPADWPQAWRARFADRWDRTVAAALVSYATAGRCDMASNVVEPERQACDEALTLWLAGDIRIADGRVIEEEVTADA